MRPAAKVTTAAEGLPRRRFTVAEVEAMVAAGVMEEDERLELIGGELVPMSPKGNRHEVVKVALLRRWYRIAPDDLDLAPETTFRLSEDTYLEPDVVIYPRATGLAGADERPTRCWSWKLRIRLCATTWVERRPFMRASASVNSGWSMRSG